MKISMTFKQILFLYKNFRTYGFFHIPCIFFFLKHSPFIVHQGPIRSQYQIRDNCTIMANTWFYSCQAIRPHTKYLILQLPDNHIVMVRNLNQGYINCHTPDRETCQSENVPSSSMFPFSSYCIKLQILKKNKKLYHSEEVRI